MMQFTLRHKRFKSVTIVTRTCIIIPWKRVSTSNLLIDFPRQLTPRQSPLNLRAKNYPPSFPNGWFNLCSSDRVKKAQVIEIDAFGQKFAVFRGNDGKIGVFNPFGKVLIKLVNFKLSRAHLISSFEMLGLLKVKFSKIVPSNKVSPCKTHPK